MNDEFVVNDEIGCILILRFSDGKMRALVDDDSGIVSDQELHALSRWLQEHGYGTE